MIASHRVARGYLQKEVAERVGMTRENYVQVETGRRKEALTPQQAVAISKALDIPMLSLVSAMGYPVDCPGFEDEEEVRVLLAYRQADAMTREFLRRGLGLETEPPRHQAAP